MICMLRPGLGLETTALLQVAYFDSLGIWQTLRYMVLTSGTRVDAGKLHSDEEITQRRAVPSDASEFRVARVCDAMS